MRSDEDRLDGQESWSEREGWSVPESGEQLEEVEAKRGEEMTEEAAEGPGPEASSESGDRSPMGDEEPVIDDYFLPFALREEAPSNGSSSEGESECE
jgi:hypothetical protein